MGTQVCRAHKSCQQLRSLLLETGLEEAEVRACPKIKVWPCSEMAGNARLLFQQATPPLAGKIVRFISTLFPNPTAVFNQDVRQLLNESPFHCPEINVDIYQPCGVTSCAFHVVERRWTRNCILYYRVRHEKDSLSVNELAILLQQDVPVVRNELTRTLKSLSQGALKETIVQEGVQDQVTHLEIDKLCCVCEKPILIKSKRVVRSGLVYCSQACHQKKPPVVVGIERTFGLPIARLLELCVTKFGSIKNMSGALGIGQNMFLDLCRRYAVQVHSAAE
jgi:hypothetical protein